MTQERETTGHSIQIAKKMFDNGNFRRKRKRREVGTTKTEIDQGSDDYNPAAIMSNSITSESGSPPSYDSGLKPSVSSVITKTEQSGYRSDGFSQRESPESTQQSSGAPSTVGNPMSYEQMEHTYGTIDKGQYLTHDQHQNSAHNGYNNVHVNSQHHNEQQNSPNSHSQHEENHSRRHNNGQNNGPPSNMPPSPSPTPSPMHQHAPSGGSKDYQTLTTVGPIYHAVQSSISPYASQPNFSVSTIIQRNQPSTAYAKI